MRFLVNTSMKRHNTNDYCCLKWKFRCIMCRAEAHKLYARKPIFDALGIQLYAVLHEHIEAEVCSQIYEGFRFFGFVVINKLKNLYITI